MKPLFERLEARGYMRCPDADPSHRYAKRLYQKRIDNDTSVLYVINIYYYPHAGSKFPAAYEIEIHYYLDDEEDDYLRITWVVRDEATVEEIEQRANWLYNTLGCVPDPLNQN